VQGGTACSYRSIWLYEYGYYWGVYYNAAPPEPNTQYGRILYLATGDYDWYVCVQGIAGRKGWYKTYSTLQGTWIGAPPKAVVSTAEVFHSVGGTVLIESVLDGPPVSASAASS
jgi:hypothetical protein